MPRCRGLTSLARAPPISEEKALLTWIERNFLIVFDNADDPSLLKSYWPSTVRGAILVTSRSPKAQEEGFAQSALPLKPFNELEGVVFLKSILPVDFHKEDEDKRAIAFLSHKFGGLPLALRQAGFFMKNKNCNPAKFLKIYERRFEDIDSYKVEGYEKTVATTWTVSINAVSEQSRILLDALSILDPDSVSADIFDMKIGHSYAKFLDDTFSKVNAQEGLTQQSLIDYDRCSKSLSIHRYLQHVTFSQLHKDHQRLQRTIDLMLDLINKYIPEIGFTAVRHPHQWKFVEKTLSHIQSIYGRCRSGFADSANAKMLVCMTKVLW